MGWLRLVGPLKIYVSFAEHHLFYRALFQKRPIIWRSPLIVATLYRLITVYSHTLHTCHHRWNTGQASCCPGAGKNSKNLALCLMQRMPRSLSLSSSLSVQALPRTLSLGCVTCLELNVLIFCLVSPSCFSFGFSLVHVCSHTSRIHAHTCKIDVNCKFLDVSVSLSAKSKKLSLHIGVHPYRYA